MSDESLWPLTKDMLLQMSEDDFRVKVLIPLFRKMGYLGVQHHHGGALEQGKDITMWQRHLLTGGRTNFAVVAKVTKVTGQASGKGSAGEVAIQIRQCFGGSYQDGATHDEQYVNEVIVACPHEIKKEAFNAINNVLDARDARQVSYVHGDELWQLVVRHLGPRGALAQLQEVGQVLENANPNYRVIATARGAQVAITVEPKHPDAETQEPLTIQATFAFPQDDEGKAAFAALVEYVDTGSPVTLDGRYVDKLMLPELLREILGEEVGQIAMASRPETPALPLTLVAEGTRGKIVMPNLEFRCIQKGQKQATFTAARGAHEFRLVLHRDGRADVSASSNFDGVNVVEALEAVQLRRLLADDCSLVFQDSRTQFPLLTATIAPGTMPDIYTEGQEKFLTDLISVQQITYIPIPVPRRDLTVAEVQTAAQVARVLKSGIVPIPVETANLSMGRRGVEQLVDSPGGSIRCALVSEESVVIADTEVRLGPVARIIDGAFIDLDERERVLDALKAADRELFDVELDCTRAHSVAVYLDYVPPEDFAKYDAMFPALASGAKQHAQIES